MNEPERRKVNLKNWIQRCKTKLIQGFESKCTICGYNRCKEALEFHHLDPTTKEFGISSWKFKNWAKLSAEAKKCICVCANCHREIHIGLIDLKNSTILSFDESKIPIPIISPPILPKQKMTPKVDWESIDLRKVLETRSALSFAKELGVSDAAIHKRKKKLIRLNQW